MTMTSVTRSTKIIGTVPTTSIAPTDRGRLQAAVHVRSSRSIFRQVSPRLHIGPARFLGAVAADELVAEAACAAHDGNAVAAASRRWRAWNSQGKDHDLPFSTLQGVDRANGLAFAPINRNPPDGTSIADFANLSANGLGPLDDDGEISHLSEFNPQRRSLTAAGLNGRWLAWLRRNEPGALNEPPIPRVTPSARSALDGLCQG